MTAMYEMASIMKHQPSPNAAISTPPIDGPMMRLPFTIVELSAIAFGRCFAVVDHLHDERLARRRVEGVDDSLHDLEDQDVRHGDHAREREHGERERLEHRQHLRDDENAVAVAAVDEDAGERARG